MLGRDRPNRELARFSYGRVHDTWHRPDAWAQFPGNRKGPQVPVPALYEKVGRVMIHHGKFYQQYTVSRNPDSDYKQVLAWKTKLGGATLAAILPPENAEQIMEDGSYLSAIGPGMLIATAALVEKNTKELVTVPGIVRPGEVMRFDEKYEGDEPVYQGGQLVY